MESPRSEHGGFRYEATGQIYSSSQGLTIASHMKDSHSNVLDAIVEEGGTGGPGDVFYDEESEGVLVEGEEDMMVVVPGEEHYRTNSQGSITSDGQKQGGYIKGTSWGPHSCLGVIILLLYSRLFS